MFASRLLNKVTSVATSIDHVHAHVYTPI